MAIYTLNGPLGRGGRGRYVCVSVRERERERERDRQTDRQTDRDRETDRDRDHAQTVSNHQRAIVAVRLIA